MNKAALITGASAGLGKEFAWLFAADGHDVVLVARRKDKLEELAKEIQGKHEKVKAHVIAEDLASPGAAERIVKALGDLGVEIEFLVNNAGFGGTGPFAESDLARQLEMVQVNVIVLMTLTRLLLPKMIARQSGRILNIGSTAGFVPGPFMSVYYASKAFVNSFTEALSVELAGTGVTITVSCPGATATEFAAVAGNEKSSLFASGVATAADVAKDGYEAMKRGEVLAVAGASNKMKIWSLRFAPRGMVRDMTAKMNQNK
jgi:short-subunit dehydrogenase